MNEDPSSKGQHRHRHSHGAQEKPAWACLDDVAFGTTCRIRRIHSNGAIRQRLLDIGLVPGAEVTVVRSAPLADPLEVRIGDSFITLRRTEAIQIEVTHD